MRTGYEWLANENNPDNGSNSYHEIDILCHAPKTPDQQSEEQQQCDLHREFSCPGKYNIDSGDLYVLK